MDRQKLFDIGQPGKCQVKKLKGDPVRSRPDASDTITVIERLQARQCQTKIANVVFMLALPPRKGRSLLGIGNKRAVSVVDNLGLGGLFIRTPDPPPAGTFIQVLIDAPTGEVRARAAVHRSSPKQGMGVKFIAMEHEHRARFAGWLKTLSS